MPSEYPLTKSYTKWEKFEISYFEVRSFVESFILANKFQFIIKNNWENLYLWKKNFSSAFVFFSITKSSRLPAKAATQNHVHV